MKTILLLILAAALGAAELRQMGPNDDLPFCRVVENEAASIDRDRPKYVAHDGWYCAATHHLFPLSAQGQMFGPIPLDPACIVKVTQATSQPGRMPPEWRKAMNDYIAKNHPQALPILASAAK